MKSGTRLVTLLAVRRIENENSPVRHQLRNILVSSKWSGKLEIVYVFDERTPVCERQAKLALLLC